MSGNNVDSPDYQVGAFFDFGLVDVVFFKGYPAGGEDSGFFFAVAAADAFHLFGGGDIKKDFQIGVAAECGVQTVCAFDDAP